MPDNPDLTLVIGGARSGKSAHAESLVCVYESPWHYVATAEVLDEEMRARVAAHRRRRGAGWQLAEAPLELDQTLQSLPAGEPVLIDCLTLWLSNHLIAGSDLEKECSALVDVLRQRSGPTFVVSNEVGQGIVPDNSLSRQFRDAAGRLNQMVAGVSGRVIMTVAGIPVQVK